MEEIPTTEDWKPNRNKSERFSKILFEKCRQVEEEILKKLNDEKYFNVNNFDSGIVVESYIRSSLEKLLPRRYNINKGILCDRRGFTSGEHDIIIFNDFWFPYLAGNNEDSERYFFPIEGIYAVGEVKQTLNISTLDEGIKKLVLAQRLYRPRVGENRYSENRKDGDVDLGTANPLFTFLIACGYDETKTKLDDIFNRFFEINKTLHRQEMVRAICVLGKFSISWAVFNEDTGVYDAARFTDKDEFLPIIPTLRLAEEDGGSSFYNLVTYLGAHLNQTILGSEDIYVAYGDKVSTAKFPPGDEYTIENY